MLLLPEILTIYILNALFVFFASIAVLLALQIVFKWDFSASTQLQYILEKRSYLASTIIRYIFYIKIPLFLFFIFTLEKISSILPGAMCAAGVVDSNEYATALLFLKILNLYLFAYWLVVDSEDMKDELLKNTRKKFVIFLALFLLLVFEIALETFTFASIDVESVVDCCGVIFSHNNDTYLSMLLNLPHEYLLALFYTVYALLIVSLFFKRHNLFAFINLAFLIVSLLSLIAFFGTYIYELPTHHCPFCLLQKEYSYIGYFLYTILFAGTFNGLLPVFTNLETQEVHKRELLSLAFNTLYLIVVTLYPLLYFYHNGVWM